MAVSIVPPGSRLASTGLIGVVGEEFEGRVFKLDSSRRRAFFAPRLSGWGRRDALSRAARRDDGDALDRI